MVHPSNGLYLMLLKGIYALPHSWFLHQSERNAGGGWLARSRVRSPPFVARPRDPGGSVHLRPLLHCDPARDEPRLAPRRGSVGRGDLPLADHVEATKSVSYTKSKRPVLATKIRPSYSPPQPARRLTPRTW